jgi:hypothetical protein
VPQTLIRRDAYGYKSTYGPKYVPLGVSNNWLLCRPPGYGPDELVWRTQPVSLEGMNGLEVDERMADTTTRQTLEDGLGPRFSDCELSFCFKWMDYHCGVTIASHRKAQHLAPLS